MEGVNVHDFAKQKFANFCVAFAHELHACNVQQPTWDDVLAQIATGSLFWDVITNRREDILATFLEASDDPRASTVWVAYQQLSPQRKDLFWRYAAFFLAATKEIIGAN